MKKINSIHFGGWMLMTTACLLIAVPSAVFLINLMMPFAFSAVIITVSVCAGAVSAVCFAVILAVEAKQDKRINIAYEKGRTSLIMIPHGKYECQNCGCRIQTKVERCPACGIVFKGDIKS